MAYVGRMNEVAVVFGARNLGGAIIQHLLRQGWRAAGVARSAETLERVSEDGALAIEADASDPESMAAAIGRASAELGRPALLVNAVSAARPPGDGPFGGGPLGAATLEDFRGWTVAVAEQAFVFLSEGAKALGEGGTLVQITGGSSRRAMPDRGLWSAGAQATRALVQAAAQELAERSIHAALLIVDATIESPKTAGSTQDAATDALADQQSVAQAVEYLANQSPRAWTHELQVTPRLDRWVP